MKFDDIGLLVPDILLPKASTDMSQWAVVACDQYSSQPEYWQEVYEQIHNKASTGHVIFPEAWLHQGKDNEIITGIRSSMQDYLQQGVLQEHPASLLRCERTLRNGKVRRGVMVALDLEHYSYEAGTETLIRATEGTIVNRLPPRIKIREQAPLEFPHIMVLIDDPQASVVEPLFAQVAEPAYDFELMQNSGHIRGDIIQDESIIRNFADNLSQLASTDTFTQKYGASAEQKPLLYAMGDGNHSFATAKAIWETMKAEQGFEAVAEHPARYALVELVNLYDTSLEFEAIHRVVFDIDAEKLLTAFLDHYREQQAEIRSTESVIKPGAQVIPFALHGKAGELIINKPQHQLAAGTLQLFIDHYLTQHSQASVDYIHGEDTTRELGTRTGNIGFLLPAINKSELFKTVIFDGALPRKTFSMGDAEDKRFYLEGRKIN